MKVRTLSCAVLLGSSTLASAQSADDLAKDLSNPGAANATLNFKLEYRTFTGTTPGASDQDSVRATFQPVFPFILPNGNNLIFRPAFLYTWGVPSLNGGRFADSDGLLDFGYDLIYSWKSADYTIGVGFTGSAPTGGSLSSNNWTLGPSLLITKPTDWGIWGLFPYHKEKIGGSGPDVSLTSMQTFLYKSLGNGWQIGSGPIMSYNWKAPSSDAWTIPVQIALSKTAFFGKQAVKFNASIEKNVVSPSGFSEDLTFAFTVSPVTKNPFQKSPPKHRMSDVEKTTAIQPIE